MPGNSKAVLEAALFAAGRPLSVGELSSIADITEDEARALVEELSREFLERGSGVEIRGFEDRYVMQVRPALARDVMKVAPRELEAPLIRTLAIIAYKQPIKQSDLVEIRGNKAYDHVKHLEMLGLVSSVRQGRTKALTTTRAFADYFGLDSDDAESVRQAIMKSTRPLGVTKMYESLALRLNIDYEVVNPYRPGDEDIEKLRSLEILVAAPGYAERIKENFSGELIEAGVRTLSQLKESAEKICASSGSGDPEPLIAEIDSLLHGYRELGRGLPAVKPLTRMIEDLAGDLRIPVSEDGITAAPDYVNCEAGVVVPTHQPYDMDILERIRQRCDALLSGLARTLEGV